MSPAALVSLAIATLPLARTDEDLDRWWKDNQSWIPIIKAEAPSEYDRLIKAGKDARARLSRSVPSSRTVSSMRS